MCVFYYKMNGMNDKTGGAHWSGNKLLLHCTFIPGINKQVISRTRALFATFVRDGEERCGGHRLRTAAVVAPLVCPTGGLRVDAACAATSLHEGGRCPMPVWNILRLLQNFKNISILSLISKFTRNAPHINPPLLFQMTQRSEMPPLSGLSRKKALCCSLSDLPVSYDCPTKQCAAYAITLYSGGRSQQVVKACWMINAVIELCAKYF